MKTRCSWKKTNQTKDTCSVCCEICREDPMMCMYQCFVIIKVKHSLTAGFSACTSRTTLTFLFLNIFFFFLISSESESFSYLAQEKIPYPLHPPNHKWQSGLHWEIKLLFSYRKCFEINVCRRSACKKDRSRFAVIWDGWSWNAETSESCLIRCFPHYTPLRHLLKPFQQTLSPSHTTSTLLILWLQLLCFYDLPCKFLYFKGVKKICSMLWADGCPGIWTLISRLTNRLKCSQVSLIS